MKIGFISVSLLRRSPIPLYLSPRETGRLGAGEKKRVGDYGKKKIIAIFIGIPKREPRSEGERSIGAGAYDPEP